MTVKNTIAASFALIFLSASIWAQGPSSTDGAGATYSPRSSANHTARRGQTVSRKNSLYSRGINPRPSFSSRSPYFYSPSFAQSFGWPGLNLGSPYAQMPYYSYSPYSSYSHLYDLYYQESQRSKQEADEFEASLERQGKLTGPAKVGAYPGDFLLFSSRNVTVTLDGEVRNPSSSSAPLVIGSGRHTLHIAAR